MSSELTGAAKLMASKGGAKQPAAVMREIIRLRMMFDFRNFCFTFEQKNCKAEKLFLIMCVCVGGL